MSQLAGHWSLKQNDSFVSLFPKTMFVNSDVSYICLAIKHTQPQQSAVKYLIERVTLPPLALQSFWTESGTRTSSPALKKEHK